MYITVAQISQMIIGVFVVAMSTYYKYWTPKGCAIDDSMLLAITLMYATYLVLFVHFFAKRFIFSPKKKQQEKHANNPATATTKLQKAQ